MPDWRHYQKKLQELLAQFKAKPSKYVVQQKQECLVPKHAPLPVVWVEHLQ